MISGITIGFVSVGALFIASLILAWLDKKGGPVREGVPKGRTLSRLALVLFLASFVGGVVVTLLSGTQPRQEGMSPTGNGMGMMGESGGGSPPPMMGAGGTIGKVDEEEFKRLQEKVASDPKDVKSRERLGHLYLQMQDFENVFKMAHEALKINPKSVESRVHMGMVLAAMGQPQEGLAQIDQALKIDPKNPEGLRFQRMLQMMGNQPK